MERNEKKMITEKVVMQTELIASEDGKYTYEVRRLWDEKGKKGLVLELYPTLSVGRVGEMDLSTMHLLNHAKDFGWGSVRIINLYSLVCNGKPKTSELFYDEKNIAYIEEILESKDISDYDIVIATGNSLATHIKTVETKIDILSMLRDKGVEMQVKFISVDLAYQELGIGVHPLFLGLHYGKDVWKLKKFPLDEELKALEESIKPKEKVKGKKDEKVVFSEERKEEESTNVVVENENVDEKENVLKKGESKGNVPKNKKQA